MSLTAKWMQVRKDALDAAGISYPEMATNDELGALCKEHGLKVTLGGPISAAQAPAPSSEVSALRQEIDGLKATLDQMIARGFTAPAPNAGSDAAVMAEAIAKAVKEQLRPEKDEQGFVDPKYIDPNDRLDKPEVFFSWRHWNLISFSMKHGVAEKPPMGNVEFVVDSGRWVRSGDENHAHYVCKAEVYSRKQANWLRAHEHFGIRFFDSVRNLNTSHGEEWARVAQKWATALAAKKPAELLTIARQNNLGTSIDEDVESLRMRVIGKLVEGEMAAIKQVQERVAMQGVIKQELVGTVG